MYVFIEDLLGIVAWTQFCNAPLLCFFNTLEEANMVTYLTFPYLGG